ARHIRLALTTLACCTESFGTASDVASTSALRLQNQPFAGTPDVKVELLTGLTFAASGTITTPNGWTVQASGDFNNDNKADIILQNNGLPQIWLMNGTSATSTVTLANPGPSWHVIAAADFDSDGNTDILWQNTDGAAAIWELNGTSIIGGGVLSPNPGASWHVIGPSDFNGDGLADIVWQNNDGTPAIWDMNGTSIIGGGLLPNPGATWHVKDDGPISPDPAGTGTPPPALHLSSPDVANAVPMFSAPDGAALHLTGVP